MNQINLMGRLTAEPELRITPNGINVTSFSLAVDRKRQKDKAVTDFFDIVAWRTHAEFAAKYLHKGQRIVITGEMQTRSYTDKNNVKRKVYEVSVNDIYFADSKSGGNDQNANFAPSFGAPPPEQGNYTGYEQAPPPGDGDLPF
jgi:single-strand DNA-binding protein